MIVVMMLRRLYTQYNIISSDCDGVIDTRGCPVKKHLKTTFKIRKTVR